MFFVSNLLAYSQAGRRGFACAYLLGLATPPGRLLAGNPLPTTKRPRSLSAVSEARRLYKVAE